MSWTFCKHSLLEADICAQLRVAVPSRIRPAASVGAQIFLDMPEDATDSDLKKPSLKVSRINGTHAMVIANVNYDSCF